MQSSIHLYLNSFTVHMNMMVQCCQFCAVLCLLVLIHKGMGQSAWQWYASSVLSASCPDCSVLPTSSGVLCMDTEVKHTLSLFHGQRLSVYSYGFFYFEESAQFENVGVIQCNFVLSCTDIVHCSWQARTLKLFTSIFVMTTDAQMVK